MLIYYTEEEKKQIREQIRRMHEEIARIGPKIEPHPRIVAMKAEREKNKK